MCFGSKQLKLERCVCVDRTSSEHHASRVPRRVGQRCNIHISSVLYYKSHLIRGEALIMTDSIRNVLLVKDIVIFIIILGFIGSKSSSCFP